VFLGVSLAQYYSTKPGTFIGFHPGGGLMEKRPHVAMTIVIVIVIITTTISSEYL